MNCHRTLYDDRLTRGNSSEVVPAHFLPSTSFDPTRGKSTIFRLLRKWRLDLNSVLLYLETSYGQ